jgi:hypothetical protein
MPDEGREKPRGSVAVRRNPVIDRAMWVLEMNVETLTEDAQSYDDFLRDGIVSRLPMVVEAVTEAAPRLAAFLVNLQVSLDLYFTYNATSRLRRIALETIGSYVDIVHTECLNHSFFYGDYWLRFKRDLVCWTPLPSRWEMEVDATG